MFTHGCRVAVDNIVHNINLYSVDTFAHLTINKERKNALCVNIIHRQIKRFSIYDELLYCYRLLVLIVDIFALIFNLRLVE